MDLKTYLSALSREEQLQFATRCRYSLGHIRNVAYCGKPCASDLAVSIERESGKSVTRQELRADWPNHWPELVLPIARAAA